MSSQICNAFEFLNNVLVLCNQKTNDKFCNKHSHKHRLEKPDECPVCLDEISSETETPLQCGHWIHRVCIQPTNLHKCSLCNQKMSKDEINYIFGEGHVEQNNYNDGTSIYWQQSQDIEDAYEEFGHDYSDEEDEGVSNETLAEEILFTRNFENATHDDIVNVLYDLEQELYTITNSLTMDQLGSQFVFRQSLITTLPTVDNLTFREFARQIIVEKSNEIAIIRNTIFTFDFETQMISELLSGPSIDMFIILFNFMRINDNFINHAICIVKLIIYNMIIEMFDHLSN